MADHPFLHADGPAGVPPPSTPPSPSTANAEAAAAAVSSAAALAAFGVGDGVGGEHFDEDGWPAPPPSAFASDGPSSHSHSTPSSTYAAVASLLADSPPTGILAPSTRAHHPPGLVPSTCYVTAHRAGRDGPSSRGPRPGNGGSAGPIVAGMTPSGPRRPGQGVEDEQQGVVSASVTPTGGLLLKVTLLAAGFIIGPSGASVREVCRSTGADVRSWTEPPAGPTARPLRAFTVEGAPSRVAAAAAIILAAVDRYVTLTDGSCAGRIVGRAQDVAGIVFSYQPPPRAVVPHAAALKSGSGGNCGNGGGGGAGSPGLGGRDPAPRPHPPPSADESTTNQGLLADLVAALQARRSGSGRGGQEEDGSAWPPARPTAARSPPGFGRAGSSPAALPHAHAQPFHTPPPASTPRWKAAMDAAAAAVAAHRTSGAEGGGWAPGSPFWSGLLATGAHDHHAPTPTPTQRRSGAEGATPSSDPPPPWAAGGGSGGTTLSFSDGPAASVARRAAQDAAQAAALAAALHNLDVLDLAGGSPLAEGGGCVWGGGGGAHHPPAPPAPPPSARLFPPPGFEHLGPPLPPNHHHHLGPITPGPGRAGRAASAPSPALGGGEGAVDHGTGPFWPGI